MPNFSNHNAILVNLNLNLSLLPSSTCSLKSSNYRSWNRASHDDISRYKHQVSESLPNLELYEELITCDDHACTLTTHRASIDKLCMDIIHTLINVSLNVLPKPKPTRYRKPYWNTLAKQERDTAIFWHRIWCECGRPDRGIVADICRTTRSKYHKTVKQLYKKNQDLRFQRIADKICQEKVRNLWHELKYLRSNKTINASSIDNCTDPESISSMFAKKYESLYNNNSSDILALSYIKECISSGVLKESCLKDELCSVSVTDVSKAIKHLKAGKSDGDTGLKSDHLLHAPVKCYYYLSLLFSAIMFHGFLPQEFLKSVIIPIPKNNNNLSNSENYRGISLCSALCKLFEHIVLSKCGMSLVSSDSQFGFKENHSTSICATVFKDITSFYLSRDTDVYCSFVDATKAFDRLKFDKLFEILLFRKVPAVFIRVLYDLYTRQKICVSWAGVHSSYFTASNGIRQGGIISPVLFNIYIDILLQRLEANKVGCFIGNHYCGCLGYADDICLIAPSVGSLQKMLDICSNFGIDYGLQFNASKSVCMHISKINRTAFDVYLGGNKLSWVKSFKYLGINVNCNLSDSEDIMFKRSLFFTSVNMLMANFGCLSDNILIHLFSSYCCSFYGSQCWDLRNKDIVKMYSAYNKALRRILKLPY